MKNINKFLYNNSLKILTVFLFLQPLIDMLTAVSLRIFNNSFIVGLGIRFIFMIYIIYYNLFLTKNKSKYINIYLLGVFIYVLLFGINILYDKGFSALSYELKSTIKSFYFPVILVGLINIFKDNKNIDIKILSKLFIIYCLGVLIPNLLGIGFISYEVTKSGSIGFFYTANEIGAIISILMVSYFINLYSNKKYIYLIISSLIVLYLLTSIGTKGPLILFIIMIMYLFIKYLKSLLKSKKYKVFSMMAISIIIFLSLFIVLLPRTNFYKNIVVHLEFLKVDSIDDIFKSEKVFDHFIFSERLSFWNKTNKIYMKSNISDKLLGIGYISNYSTDNASMKMVEMDFVDIFYRHGIIGFIIYMGSLLLIIYRIFTFRKKKFDNKEIYVISIAFSIVLALITGHVLVAPAVSIFVALIINLFYNQIIGDD